MGLNDLFKRKATESASEQKPRQPPQDRKPPEARPVAGHRGILCNAPEEVEELVFKVAERGRQVKGATLEGQNAAGYLLDDGPFKPVAIIAESGMVLTFYPMAEGRDTGRSSTGRTHVIRLSKAT